MERRGRGQPKSAASLTKCSSASRFFDGGRKWLKGELRNGRRKYCLLGAMDQLPRHDLMLTYLLPVARTRHAHCPFGTPIMALMNDSCRDFKDLRGCLIEARALAAADLWTLSNA